MAKPTIYHESESVTKPDPLTPADCDLRDFAWMPIECARLLTSETWLLGTAEQKIAALTLWMKSWHQVPAGSLPANDRMLAILSDAGLGWRRVRDHVMRGWIECSDGRIYHPVVCEKARESWEHKQSQRLRTAKARQAKAAMNTSNSVSKDENTNCEPFAKDFVTVVIDNNEPSKNVDENSQHNDIVGLCSSVTEDVTGDVTASNGPDLTRSNLEEKKGRPSPIFPKPKSAASTAPDGADFEAWWLLYPKRVAKGRARTAYAKAIGKTDVATLAAAAARVKDGKYTRHPATWLNDEGWLDEPELTMTERAFRAVGLDPHTGRSPTTQRENINPLLRIVSDDK